MVAVLIVLFVVAVGLVVILGRSKPSQDDQTTVNVIYSANGPIYNGQLWKR